MTLHHASCVDINGKGILILGQSGSGKSDLALRLMDVGGQLVSDDYVHVDLQGGQLCATPAPNIEGLIEVRGVGLMKCDYKDNSPLHLALELTSRDKIDRLPEKEYFEQDGVKIPLYKFYPFESSAVAKIRMMLK